MARKNKQQEDGTAFNNAQDYGLLYNYVRAVNEIVSGQGEFYEKANLQLNGQVDNLIRPFATKSLRVCWISFSPTVPTTWQIIMKSWD